MKNYDRPPASLRIPPTELRKTSSAEWRDWKSSAQACSEFRRDFRDWALRNQGARCAYCALKVGRMVRRTETLDHFIPKGPSGGYARWTYEPLNLLVACHECNSRIKGSELAVRAPAPPAYEACEFTMFHPYLHRPATAHFSGGYQGVARPRRIKAESALGLRTIELFQLTNAGLRQTWRADFYAAKRDRRISRLPNALRKRLLKARSEVN